MMLDLLLAKARASRILLLRTLVVRVKVARTRLLAPIQAAPAVVWMIATFGLVISVHM